MATSDLRDVLELPADGAQRPAKKGKPFGHRQSLKGLAREVQSLGGDTPIAIVQHQMSLKKRRFGSRKPAAKWETRAFTNSARVANGADPDLVLRHWRRKDAVALGPDGMEVEPGQPEDSIFARYNVKVSTPQYTDEQYHAHLQSEDWTKEETDYLIELAQEFDLRWPLIWDRYDFVPRKFDTDVTMGDGVESGLTSTEPPKDRSMEDMKARYYHIQAKLMALEKPHEYMTVLELELYNTLANFNPTQERLRKEFAVNTLSRTPAEVREEELLLVEIKRVLARNERFNEERKELYSRLDYPKGDATDISSIRTSAGLHNLIQTLHLQDKSRKRRSIVGVEGAVPGATGTTEAATASGKPSASATPTPTPTTESHVVATHKRRESLLPLQTPTESKPSTSALARRDSSVSTPTTAAKKGAHPLQERRKLTDQEMAVYGVSHHDRLTSGASFRTEKTNKLFASKSNSQQQRITNVLLELDIPPRLIMPTAAVSGSFERLLQAVNGLLDCRKVSDKLDAELKLERAKKAERERLEKERKAAEGDSEDVKAEEEEQGQGQGQKQDQEAGEEEAVDEDHDDDAGDDDRREENGHKRSASVLSTQSDKSSKRLKK